MLAPCRECCRNQICIVRSSSLIQPINELPTRAPCCLADPILSSVNDNCLPGDKGSIIGISGWWSFRAEALGLENAKAAGRILPGAIARLKPEMTLKQAHVNALLIYHRVAKERAGPELSPQALQAIERLTLDLAPASRGFAPERQSLAKPLAVLMIVVGLVLLIACANVATFYSTCRRATEGNGCAPRSRRRSRPHPSPIAYRKLSSGDHCRSGRHGFGFRASNPRSLPGRYLNSDLARMSLSGQPFVYDVATGLVEIVVPPAPIRTA
jgi:hypothetical protein